MTKMNGTVSGETLTASNETVAYLDRPIGKMHTFYLGGHIKGPESYTGWFETIRNASDHDIICLHINSCGGDAFTAVQFMRVMRETNANVVASVEGACMSAATLIFLAAKHWEISSHSVFMFHDYSSWAVGKGGEMYDELTHFRKWSEHLWKDAYGDFLSKDEIKQILDNKDIWMSGDEVAKRLQNRKEEREKKAGSVSSLEKPVKPKKKQTKKTK